METKKVLLFIFLYFLCSCSYQKRISSTINKEQGIRFYNSRNEKALYIKKNRENLIKLHLLDNEKIVGKHYIIEEYLQESEPKMMFAGIINNSKIQYYYNKEGFLIKDNNYLPDSDKKLYRRVYAMALKGEYDSIKKMHDVNNRKLSHSSNCYLTIIEFYDSKKFKIERIIQFQSFGINADDSKDFDEFGW